MTDRHAPPPESGIERLLNVVDVLRGDRGCPWDREQTLESLKPYLIEECYEVLEAIDRRDPDLHAEELGDLLLQIALHARIRAEENRFTFQDVADRLADKLIRRHPHVFADNRAATTGEVLKNWEAIKAEETGGPTRPLLEGVPRQLPALQKAQRVQARAARVGFDWHKAADVWVKMEEELTELREAMRHGDARRIADEIGDLLFTVVNLSRFACVDAEDALRRCIERFMGRFRIVEQLAAADSRSVHDCTPEELEAHWNVAKRKLSTPGESLSDSP